MLLPIRDQDTQDVPGSPNIAETILKKIDDCRVFVGDLTHIGPNEHHELTPNPNVLIEYGYALKSVGYGRMIAVLNKAFGDPRSKPLPFDLQHKRWPFIYDARPSDPEQERRSERNRLSQKLQSAIRSVLDHESATTRPRAVDA